MWEVSLADEMEQRVDAVERGEMKLHDADGVFAEMRRKLHS